MVGMKVHDVAARLEALGNPTRLEIVRALVRTGHRGLPVGQLRTRIDIAASTLSHHLARLVTVGLVSQERRGTTLICRAELDAMKDTADYLVAECCSEETLVTATVEDPSSGDDCCGPDCCTTKDAAKASG